MAKSARSTRIWIGLAAVTLLVGAAPALAQTGAGTRAPAKPAQDEKPGPWSVSGGVGFTLDPDTFLMSLGAEYAGDEGFSAGPLLQVGVSDKHAIVAPTANGRYSFDLSDADDDVLRKFRPFVQGGLGFAYVEKDRNGPLGDREDVGFLLNMGFGLEYPVSERVSLGTSLLFNVLPVKTANQHFFFSWQVATVRFHF
jgi:hypothetical protein